MKKFSALLAGTAVALCALPGLAAAERGSDGQVNLIYWQAPSTMNAYLSSGTKDLHAASLVMEPLIRFNPDGEIVPWLVDEIPTQENGGINEDFTAITWTLSEGLLWSDGTPVTSEDVRFTWQYCMAEGGGCSQADKFVGVRDVEVIDERSVTVHFETPKYYPYAAFSGLQSPIIQKAQFENCLGAAAPTCTEANFNPIGTGPFVVEEFRPNDVITMVANENYREADKPAFSNLVLKGGGDARAAFSSVLETGEFDYAWNGQLAPDVIADMVEAGNGQVIASFGSLVERILINLSDPSPELGEERSTVAHPHPFLTDPAVRQALSMAIDRELLVEIGYGDAGRATCNVLPAPAVYNSPNNDACLTQDIAGANALLDEAGWVDSNGNGIRDKDGVELMMLYQTSTNAVRQDFQALIKQWWSEIGVETELRNISGSVFFGSDPGSPDTIQKFYADVEMFANQFDGTDPESYMANWKCSEIPGPESQWQGSNRPRFCSDEYDALVAELAQAGDLEERARIAIAMNDMLMQNHIILPLVHRGDVAAHANSLGNASVNSWDTWLWNIADWYRIDE